MEFDGDERGAVLERAVQTRTIVSASLGERRAPADGVVSWSAPQLRVWEARPWSQAGEQLPLVHHAAASISAVFDDRDRLATWLSSIAEIAGVAVEQIEWSLTDSSRIAAETEALGSAVADARRRADAIASALGYLSLRPIAVSDPGLLPSTEGPHPLAASDVVTPRLSAASVAGDGSGIAAEPDDLVIEVVVHARFIAD